MTAEFDLRVAAVVAAPHWGGLQTVIARTEASLRAAGVARTVIIPPNTTVRRRLEAAGCDVVEIELKRPRRPPNWAANWEYLTDFRAGTRRLTELYNQVGADVVDVAGLHHIQPAYAAKQARLPLVWAAHSTAIAQPLRMLAGLHASVIANYILCSGASLAHRHGGLSRDKVIVFRAPVDTCEFKPDLIAREASRQALDVAPDDCVVGALGTFGWQKNHGLLIQTAKALSARRGNLKFRICGTPVDADSEYFEQNVRKPIQEAGLAADGYVRVVEQTLPPSVLLNGFDIFALPSKAEGLSLVTGEAAATGLPLLCSDVGSIPDLVESGRNGRLLSPNSVSSWVEAIENLATNEDLRAGWGKCSREFALERIGLQASADDHLKAYRAAAMN
ncbi:glycosyltransferase family 4 protein [Oceanicaulis alexandrii]|uniref:glycosyltransferase family 4 protein n=1 Tax=Oceanicaulis alexandrii TaxID=153233 RepID=UPI003BAEAF7B